jgi:hypothetical protein
MRTVKAVSPLGSTLKPDFLKVRAALRTRSRLLPIRKYHILDLC